MATRRRVSHCVCEFQLLDGSMAIETVSYSWLFESDGAKLCWYPPEDVDSDKVQKAVTKITAPDPSKWKMCSYHLLGRYGKVYSTFDGPH